MKAGAALALLILISCSEAPTGPRVQKQSPKAYITPWGMNVTLPGGERVTVPPDLGRELAVVSQSTWEIEAMLSSPAALAAITGTAPPSIGFDCNTAFLNLYNATREYNQKSTAYWTTFYNLVDVDVNGKVTFPGMFDLVSIYATTHSLYTARTALNILAGLIRGYGCLDR